MLTENRKRRRSYGSDESQSLPQAKRSGGGHSLVPELGRDVWDSESSSSDSSAISSPEQGTGVVAGLPPASDGGGSHSTPGPCSPVDPTHHTEEMPVNLGPYHHINRILREAHFNRLQSRGQQGAS